MKNTIHQLQAISLIGLFRQVHIALSLLLYVVPFIHNIQNNNTAFLITFIGNFVILCSRLTHLNSNLTLRDNTITIQ